MDVVQNKRIHALHRLRQEVTSVASSPAKEPQGPHVGNVPSMKDVMEMMTSGYSNGYTLESGASGVSLGHPCITPIESESAPVSGVASLRTYTLTANSRSKDRDSAACEALVARKAWWCCPAFLDGGDIGSLPISSLRVKVYLVLDGFLVRTFLAAVVLANAVQVVYESDQTQLCDFGAGSEQEEACAKVNGWLLFLNWVYLGIYSVELVLRMFVDRMRFFSDKWDVFDFLIVSVGVASQLLKSHLPSTGIFRLFRLSRLAKALYFVKLKGELHLMLHGMYSAARAIILGSALIASAVLLWSVAAVEFLGELNRNESILAHYAELGCERCPRAWESVWQACLSILSTTLMGDSWGTYALPMVERHPATIIVFLGTSFSIVLGLTNLILAVIVDKALQQQCLEDERDLALQRDRELNHARKRFVEMCRQIDSNQDGTLSLDEFLTAYDNVEAFREGLTLMGLFQKHELEVLFNMIDKSGSNSVGYEEFALHLATMKSQDLHAVTALIKHQLMDLSAEVADIKDALTPMVESSTARWQIQLAHRRLSGSSISGFDKDSQASEGTAEGLPLQPHISTRRQPEWRKMARRQDSLESTLSWRGDSSTTAVADEVRKLSEACSRQTDLMLRHIRQQDVMAQQAMAKILGLAQEANADTDKSSLRASGAPSDQGRPKNYPSTGMELLSQTSSDYGEVAKLDTKRFMQVQFDDSGRTSQQLEAMKRGQNGASRLDPISQSGRSSTSSTLQSGNWRTASPTRSMSPSQEIPKSTSPDRSASGTSSRRLAPAHVSEVDQDLRVQMQL